MIDDTASNDTTAVGEASIQRACKSRIASYLRHRDVFSQDRNRGILPSRSSSHKGPLGPAAEGPSGLFVRELPDHEIGRHRFRQNRTR